MGSPKPSITWIPVQRLLAANGVASLLFDFSGYGRSTGRVDWTPFELDAVSAFEYHAAPRPRAAPFATRIFDGQRHCCRHHQPRSGKPPRAVRGLHFVPRRRTLHRHSGANFPFCPAHLARQGIVVRVSVARARRSWRKGPPVSRGNGPRTCILLRPERKVAHRARHVHTRPFRKPQLSDWGPIISFLVSEPAIPALPLKLR